jgi:hypothetical protein
MVVIIMVICFLSNGILNGFKNGDKWTKKRIICVARAPGGPPPQSPVRARQWAKLLARPHSPY